jgi:hypothetical protein
VRKLAPSATSPVHLRGLPPEGFSTNRSVASGSWTSATQQTLQPFYDCSGDGTYTYRIVTDAYAQSGLYTQSVQSLNYLRVAC